MNGCAWGRSLLPHHLEHRRAHECARLWRVPLHSCADCAHAPGVPVSALLGLPALEGAALRLRLRRCGCGAVHARRRTSEVGVVVCGSGWDWPRVHRAGHSSAGACGGSLSHSAGRSRSPGALCRHPYVDGPRTAACGLNPASGDAGLGPSRDAGAFRSTRSILLYRCRPAPLKPESVMPRLRRSGNRRRSACVGIGGGCVHPFGAEA